MPHDEHGLLSRIDREYLRTQVLALGHALNSAEHMRVLDVISRLSIEGGWAECTTDLDNISVNGHIATRRRVRAIIRQLVERGTLDPGEEPSPLVFRGRGGGRVWDFRKALATAVAAAGVTRAGQPLHITPHMFRKAHATWLAERGVNDALLQPRLGHAPGSRVTQESYVHVQSPEALKATVILLDNHRRTA